MTQSTHEKSLTEKTWLGLSARAWGIIAIQPVMIIPVWLWYFLFPLTSSDSELSFLFSVALIALASFPFSWCISITQHHARIYPAQFWIVLVLVSLPALYAWFLIIRFMSNYDSI